METIFKKLDFKKGKGLIPVIVQHSISRNVLMLGYMNEKAFRKTMRTGKVWFYSRSKKRLWMKGEISRNILKFIDMKVDCDGDTLLIETLPFGPACHTGKFSCFGDKQFFELQDLYALLLERKSRMPKGSYTTSLFQQGLSRICEKVEEESAEVIKAAKKETKKRLIEESADLLYHLLVLFVFKKISLNGIFRELMKRRNAGKK